MTGVQTCALPICFPVTIGDEYEQRVKSIAIAISKSIKKTGIKPKPFLVPAFNEVMRGFNERVTNALNRVLR